MVSLNGTHRGVPSDLTAGLLGRLASAQDRTNPDISYRSCALSLLAVLALAGALQTGLLLSGLYSLSADESARALLAHKLTFANAFEPFIWPPLGTILNSLALALHDDLFLTPRLLVSFTGLLAILGVAFVTFALFANRLMSVVAATLAILVPHRLLLSVAPLSDIFSMTLLLYAAGFVVTWLRTGRTSALNTASVFLLFAAMTRYELWFFNAVLALYLAYRALIRRDLEFGQLAFNGVLLAFFPIFWVLRVYDQAGNLNILTQASRQFIDAHGHDYATAFRANVAADLVHDVLLNPVLIVGACLAGFLAARQGVIRHWLILILMPLVVLAADMAISLGVPMAAPFRIDGTWVLLLLPFAAFALVFAVEKITSDHIRKYGVLALATYIAVAPFGLEAHLLAKGMQVPGVLNSDDLALGRYLRAQVAEDDGNILLDAIGSLDYLNVPVAANMPDRVMLNVDEDAVAVANYMDARGTYQRRHDRVIVERYLTDKYELGGAIDREKLKARKISHLVIQDPGFIKALDTNPQVTRLASFGRWVVYHLKS